MTFRADLHCHSTHSDGTNTPEEIVEIAVRNGLKGLSITDHDTIASYPAVFEIAKAREIKMGTGVELSSFHAGVSVHVLGYAFAPLEKNLLEFCQRHEKRRKERNKAILQKLEKFSMPILEEELPSFGTVGRPHIAKLMVQKGYVASIEEAFHAFLAEGKSCYAQGTTFSLEETLSVLHMAKAKAFLAHPHLFRKNSIVKKLLELPFDGIECYYARCPPDEERRFLQMAKDRGLLISGGSDFHGAIKPNLSLGARYVDEPTFYSIFG